VHRLKEPKCEQWWEEGAEHACLGLLPSPLGLENIPTLPSRETALAGSKGYGESWCYFNFKN